MLEQPSEEQKHGRYAQQIVETDTQNWGVFYEAPVYLAKGTSKECHEKLQELEKLNPDIRNFFLLFRLVEIEKDEHGDQIYGLLMKKK